MKISSSLLPRLSAGLLALAAAAPLHSRAADHGDAPALAQDQGADANDLFLFMDPNGGGASDVVLIGTFHGFITPGESPNFGVFDPNIHYRFEIFNDHVNVDSPALSTTATPAQKAAYLNRVKANRIIDIGFSPRQALADATGTPPNSALDEAVRRPSPQTATVVLTGFPGALNRGVIRTTSTAGPITALNPSSTATAPDPATAINTLAATASTQIKFFAGLVDDPFFFDLPAFSAFVESVRNGAPNTAVFTRARDTFAGYNTLAIAFSIPKALLLGTNGTKIGADFMTLRRSMTIASSNGLQGSAGIFRAIDRVGNPAINVALVPFNKKNAYNGGNARADVALRFAGASAADPGIIQVLAALGVTPTTPNATAFNLLANIAIAKGDILQLDTNIANVQMGATGGGGDNTATGFGTSGGGRRLDDDVIDTILQVITGSSAAGDGVPFTSDTASGVNYVPTTTFPFLHAQHPALANGVTDDGTRN